jgi:hypothetical protein
MKERKHIALICLMTDLALSVWSYFNLTNYEEYIKAVQPMISSPDFQVQIYQVFLQTLTFTLSLFLLFHLIIYYFFWKEKNYATKYVYYYTFMAVVSCLFMIGSQIYWAIFPMAVYGMSFVATKKMTKK